MLNYPRRLVWTTPLPHSLNFPRRQMITTTPPPPPTLQRWSIDLLAVKRWRGNQKICRMWMVPCSCSRPGWPDEVHHWLALLRLQGELGRRHCACTWWHCAEGSLLFCWVFGWLLGGLFTYDVHIWRARLGGYHFLFILRCCLGCQLCVSWTGWTKHLQELTPTQLGLSVGNFV